MNRKFWCFESFVAYETVVAHGRMNGRNIMQLIELDYELNQSEAVNFNEILS